MYIPDGRWAKLKALKNTYEDFKDLGNAFGYLRGPWNLNPNPYVSRFAIAAPPLPTCDAYYEGLTMTNYQSFLQWAPFDPHAPIHGGAGGIFGCDKLDQLRDAGLINDEQAQRTICAEWGFTVKDLYRGNYIAAKTDCSYKKLTDEGISCGFQCTAENYEELPRKLSALIQGVQGRLDLTTEQWEQWRDFLCEGDGWKVRLCRGGFDVSSGRSHLTLSPSLPRFCDQSIRCLWATTWSRRPRTTRPSGPCTRPSSASCSSSTWAG